MLFYNVHIYFGSERGILIIADSGPPRYVRDLTAGKCWLRHLIWWAESIPLGWDRIKVSENLGATVVAAVAPVAPVVTSLDAAVIFVKKTSLWLRLYLC